MFIVISWCLPLVIDVLFSLFSCLLLLFWYLVFDLML